MSSSNGNDSNSGTSPENAWQTLTKVNKIVASLLSGDRILFACGDTFQGSVGLALCVRLQPQLSLSGKWGGPQPVVIGAYQPAGRNASEHPVFSASRMLPSDIIWQNITRQTSGQEHYVLAANLSGLANSAQSAVVLYVDAEEYVVARYVHWSTIL